MIEAPPRIVLLIDDSPEDRVIIRRFLTHQSPHSYTLIEAGDAAEGLRLWHEHQPDCVLLDLQLPDLSGFELLEAFQGTAETYPVAVVVLTGRDDTATAIRVLTSGAKDYLRKDVLTPAELHRTLEKVIENVQLQREHQHSIEKLHASEQRLRLFERVASEMHEALIVTEARPIGQPGPRIVYVNPAFTRMTGYALEEIVGATPRILQGPKTSRAELDRIREALERWKPVSAELVNYRKDGSEFNVEFQIVPVADETGWFTHWVSVQRDTTSRKRAEEERERLLAQEQAARVVAEQAHIRLAHLHTITAAFSQAQTTKQIADILMHEELPGLLNHAGTVGVVSSSREYIDIVVKWGYSKEVASAWQTVPIDMQMPLAEAARTGKPIWLSSRAEGVAQYPGLAYIWPASSAWAILPLQHDQRVIGVWGISFANEQHFLPGDRDFLLTVAQQCAHAIHRAQLYEIANRARDSAEAAVQMRDQFLAIATHELKNPLTAMLGNAQLLQRRVAKGLPLAERELHMLDTIVSQALRLNRMLSTLLDVSRMEMGQMQIVHAQVDIVALVSRIVDEMRPGPTIHTLVYSAPEASMVIEADATHMEQVAQNLISNAIKYSPGGGTVAVQVAARGNGVEISVTDQGLGIPASKLPHLFQRFYRAESADTQQISGSGIGLYIVKEIVALHQGEVTVESVEGQGSTFTVRLPLAKRAAGVGAE